MCLPPLLLRIRIDTAFDKATPFSTLPVREAWNSSPNGVFFVLYSSDQNCSMTGQWTPGFWIIWFNSEAFPIRQRVCWITERTYVAGTVISVSLSKPSSSQGKVRGECRLERLPGSSPTPCHSLWGISSPRIWTCTYLSTFGASKSGLGCSLKRASCSSLDRQCLRWRSKYF